MISIGLLLSPILSTLIYKWLHFYSCRYKFYITSHGCYNLLLFGDCWKRLGVTESGVTESGVNEPRSRSVPSGIGTKNTKKEEGRRKKLGTSNIKCAFLRTFVETFHGTSLQFCLGKVLYYFTQMSIILKFMVRENLPS